MLLPVTNPVTNPLSSYKNCCSTAELTRPAVSKDYIKQTAVQGNKARGRNRPARNRPILIVGAAPGGVAWRYYRSMVSRRTSRSRAGRWLLPALVAGLAAGCADLTWVRPDTTTQQLDVDQTTCRREAFVRAKDRYESDRWFFGALRPGATRTGADHNERDRYQREKARVESERTLNEREAFLRCMETRGYQQVERPGS